ncbi:MAG: DUF4382 domain-containing protein [Bacteroidales bacterium]|nr:DUF4382 domain-containing protein [Bacteroidales bacterium]MCF8333490.1 DUF4382 domain-containing protein [Bacteroidales bacterium]
MKSVIFVLGALFLFSACEKEENSSSDSAVLNIRLTDAPANYEEVLIDVEEVRIHVSSDEGEGNWQTLENVNTGIYNLLEFTNGVDTVLAQEEMPAGTISQMRLVLGSENSIKVNGEYYDLQTPSAQQSGLKFNVHAELTPGLTYEMWIDFDAGRSVVKRGNGEYLLKPVIRTYTEATSGAVKGVVEPVEADPYIMAISENDDTISTYADTTSGQFLIEGLEPGAYDVEFEPVDDFTGQTVEDVDVSVGQVTSIDTITFQ